MLSYFKCKKIGLSKIWNTIHKSQVWVRDLNFFLKCSSFDAESEYDVQKFFLTLIFIGNSFFPTPVAEKPWFSRNLSSEHFGENFLETKRKSMSRNPYKPEDNSKCSATLKIVFWWDKPIDRK